MLLYIIQFEDLLAKCDRNNNREKHDKQYKIKCRPIVFIRTFILNIIKQILHKLINIFEY